MKKWLAIAAVLLLLWCLIPQPELIDGVSFSRAVYDEQGNLLRLTLSQDEKYRHYVKLINMSPRIIQLTLLQEDRLFFRHPGFNPASLVRAFWQTYIQRNRLGGSTLTMQVARLRYRLYSKTISGKLLQILRAVQLERHYSKNEILEAYLNLAPYGGNVEGIGAASLVYFGKEVNALTLPEAITLTTIPQQPLARTPSENIANNEHLDRARQRLFKRWLELHPDDINLSQAMLSPLRFYTPKQLPFRAPHFVDFILSKKTTNSRIDTTLNFRLQHVVETQISQFVKHKQKIGVKNAAALLIDHVNMEVKAMVGSADFFNPSIEGQVNGTLSKRSPGSTLKPLAYSLAIDQGLIHEMTMLKDSPIHFADFDPENFDHEFLGPIHAKDALNRSRNVPAVQLATQLRDPSFYEFLKSAGLSLTQNEDYYGVTLILGGAEISAWDLAGLFSLFPNRGTLKPIRCLKVDPVVEGKRLLSLESTFIVRNILREHPRPGQNFRNAWLASSLAVAWKTGTSFGFRDAWTVGTFGPYVLVVWIGNFDGQGNPAFLGRELAAPLFFKIVDAVKAALQVNEVVDLPPSTLSRTKVCSLSGLLPGPHCPHKTETWFIPGKSPIKTCDVHREIAIDQKTGLRTCLDSGNLVRKEVYEFWTSDLLRLFRLAGIPRRIPPRDDSSCSLELRASQGKAPQIISPRQEVNYQLRAGKAVDSIPLSAVVDADVRSLHWFANEQYLGRSPPAEPLFWNLQPGIHTIRVSDDRGRSDARTVRVAVAK